MDTGRRILLMRSSSLGIREVPGQVPSSDLSSITSHHLNGPDVTDGSTPYPRNPNSCKTIQNFSASGYTSVLRLNFSLRTTIKSWIFWEEMFEDIKAYPTQARLEG